VLVFYSDRARIGYGIDTALLMLFFDIVIEFTVTLGRFFDV
jgi:hypothetical protein